MEQLQLTAIANNYRPSKTALKRLERVSLLMLVGPSGVGKSTLIKASGMAEVVGDASRIPRANEKNGVDYWFRNEDEMLEQIGRGYYLQVAVGSEGDIKATHAESFPQSGQAIFAVVASAVPVFRSLPFASTATAVIIPPDYDSWMERLDAHRTTLDKLTTRLVEAKKSFEFALGDSEARFVLNDNVEHAVRRLRQVAAGEPPDDEGRARQIAALLLNSIG